MCTSSTRRSATVIAGTGVSTPAGGLSGEGVPALEADIHRPADANADAAGNLLSSITPTTASAPSASMA
jgi:hypothetical protein